MSKIDWKQHLGGNSNALAELSANRTTLPETEVQEEGVPGAFPLPLPPTSILPTLPAWLLKETEAQKSLN